VRYADAFQNGQYIAVGFTDFYLDDLGHTSEAEFRQRAVTPAERTFASQLIAFEYHAEIGDYVIAPFSREDRATSSGR